ncbi:hypothetical protein QBC46DRAFT_267844, partial [Diplogelasinospora grovesii]
GYDAYVVRKSAASANQLIDHAANLLADMTNDRASHNASSRRLIFVAHSLGGLVCKEAVLRLRNNPAAHLRGIFDCDVGIASMGTPYRGSWMADWAKILNIQPKAPRPVLPDFMGLHFHWPTGPFVIPRRKHRVMGQTVPATAPAGVHHS